MPHLKEDRDWINATAAMAREAKHVFPEMAACEAALESAFGRSALAVQGKNLFGTKQHKHHLFDTLVLPTREFNKETKEWETDGNAAWVKYPTLKDCFEDRMATLKRLAPKYPHYAKALAAKDAIEYVREVSQTWATDPRRGEHVLMVYAKMFPELYASDLAQGQPETPNEVPMNS